MEFSAVLRVKSLLGPFRDFSRLSRFFRGFFQTLGGSGAGGPGKFFSEFFGVLGPEGPRDPCKWSTDSQGMLNQPSGSFLETLP